MTAAMILWGLCLICASFNRSMRKHREAAIDDAVEKIIRYRLIEAQKERDAMTVNSWVRGWNVQSRSDPDTKHWVSQAVGGHFGCTCGKWKFAPAPKPDCHHIMEIRANLGLLTADFSAINVNRKEAALRARSRINATAIEEPMPAPIVIQTERYVITALSADDLLAASSSRKIRKREE